MGFHMNKEEKKQSEDENKERTFAVNKAAKSTGITSERSRYNAKNSRAKYDDVSKRNKFRDKQFGDSKTITDPYTGKILHKDTQAAKNKYGSKKYNEHTAHSDHTKPIEKIVNGNRDNPFLSDEDIKTIANIDENYKLINGHLNESKRHKTNTQTAKDNNLPKAQADKMIQAEKKANAAVAKKTVELTVKGVHKSGKEGAKSAIAVEASISTAKNVRAVIKGDEEIDEALLNIAIDSAKAGATGYTASVAKKATEGVTHKAAHTIVEKTANSTFKELGERTAENLVKFVDDGSVGKVVTIVYEAGTSVRRYLNGEIDSDDLVMELGEKGTGLAFAFAGGPVGALAGGVAGGIVGGIICSYIPVVGTELGVKIGFKIGSFAGEFVGNLVGYYIGSVVYKEVRDFFPDHKRIKREIDYFSELANQIQQYRTNLENLLSELQLQNDEKVLAAFEQMHDSILADNPDEFTKGLQDICDMFGYDVRYKTNSEFMTFWNNPDDYMLI